jgi:hypothetical protein
VRLGATSDEMIEKCNVAIRGNVVEQFQREVTALSGPCASVDTLCVGLINVHTVIEEPIDILARVCVVSRYGLAIHLLLSRTDLLQNTMPIDSNIMPEFHKEFN